jgi:hypothetical protein
MILGFALLAPVAVMAGHGERAVVEAGVLPGGSIEAVAIRPVQSVAPASELAAAPVLASLATPTVKALTSAAGTTVAAATRKTAATKATAKKKAAAAKAAAAKKAAALKAAALKAAAAKKAAEAKVLADKVAAKKAAEAKVVADKAAAANAAAVKAAAAKKAADAKRAAEVAAFVAAVAANQATSTTEAPMRKSWTKAQVEQVIRDVWPDDLEDHAIAIARRESNLIPTAHNWCCYGLFAIYFQVGKRFLNSIGVTSAAQLSDPVTNARAAYAMYRASGWKPWSS